MNIGEMRERLRLLTAEAESCSVATLVRSGPVVTVTTAAAHGFTTGEWVTIAGAVPLAYNIKGKVTVTGTTTFTFAISGAPATPATGTITATFTSDAQGNVVGVRSTWRVVDTIAARLDEQRPPSEGIAAGAMQALGQYVFTVRARNDLAATMRLFWTPSATGGPRLLVINGVGMSGDGRTWMKLVTSEATS